jgi:hypothetical protein
VTSIKVNGLVGIVGLSIGRCRWKAYGWSMGDAQVIWASQLGRPPRSWRASEGNHGAMATGVNDYHLLPIFLISLIALLSATEFGRWLGARVSDQGADEVLTLQGAVLGLLALMIAFTFAMALSRFEGRRDAAK